METLAVSPLDVLLVLEARAPFKGQRLRTFTQKVLFRSEYDAIEAGKPAFPRFKFFRWKNGPYSTEAAEVENLLSRRGLLSSPDGPLTRRGRHLLDLLRAECAAYPEAADALSQVHARASRYAAMPSLDAVLEEVYALPIETSSGRTTVGSAEHGEDLIEFPALDEAALKGLRQLLDAIWWHVTADAEDEADLRSPTIGDPDDAERFVAEAKSYIE